MSSSCVVCMTAFSQVGEVRSLPCGDKLCLDCFNRWVEHLLEDDQEVLRLLKDSSPTEDPTQVKVKCPNHGHDLTLESISQFGSVDQQESLASLLTRACVSKMSDSIACPKCNTHGFLESSAWGVCSVECCHPKCGHHFTVKLSGGESRLSFRDWWSWALSAGWKYMNSRPCPKCSALVEKAGGCDHITCWKCDAQWCWGCNQQWTSRHYETCPYSPFRIQLLGGGGEPQEEVGVGVDGIDRGEGGETGTGVLSSSSRLAGAGWRALVSSVHESFLLFLPVAVRAVPSRRNLFLSVVGLLLAMLVFWVPWLAFVFCHVAAWEGGAQGGLGLLWIVGALPQSVEDRRRSARRQQVQQKREKDGSGDRRRGWNEDQQRGFGVLVQRLWRFVYRKAFVPFVLPLLKSVGVLLIVWGCTLAVAVLPVAHQKCAEGKNLFFHFLFPSSIYQALLLGPCAPPVGLLWARTAWWGALSSVALFGTLSVGKRVKRFLMVRRLRKSFQEAGLKHIRVNESLVGDL